MIPFGDIPQEGPPRQTIASGFPEAALSDAGTDQRTIIGTATWVGNEPKRFDIDVASALPSDPAEWGGFSGAALFSDNLLVGVVRTYDPSWQGKLEATPATFLLDDPSFQAYCHTAGLPPPIRLDAGPMDTTIRLDFDQDAETTGLLRFSPRNPHVPFIGREPELQSLQHFLFADTAPPFSWWLMTGGGGNRQNPPRSAALPASPAAGLARRLPPPRRSTDHRVPGRLESPHPGPAHRRLRHAPPRHPPPPDRPPRTPPRPPAPAPAATGTRGRHPLHQPIPRQRHRNKGQDRAVAPPSRAPGFAGTER